MSNRLAPRWLSSTALTASAVIVVAICATAGLATGAAAQPSTLVLYKALALAPDGTRLATIDSAEAEDTAVLETHGNVVVRDARTGAVIASYDPCVTCSYAGTSWSPDGSAVAFVASDSAAGTATLMVASGAANAGVGSGGAANAAGLIRTLAVVRGVAQTPRWAPDGRRIALLVVAGAHKAIGAVEAGRAQVGEIGEADDEQRIAVVDVAGGSASATGAASGSAAAAATALRFVSPADTFVYEYGWTPDGRGFVATAAKGNGDNNWWVANLVAVDGASGSVRTIAAPSYQLDMPRVSPDGSRVLFIGGLMSDFGSIGGDLYEVPFAGGVPRNLTEGAKATVTSLSWTNATPIVTRLAADRMEVARVTLSSGTAQLTPLWSAPVSGSAEDGRVAVAANGSMMASVLTDFTHPPEINVAALGEGSVAFRMVTTGNALHTALVSARSISWSSDGRAVQGWLLSPPASRPGKSAMIVEIHGGPSAAATPNYVWNGLTRGLIEHGYDIFLPNPRGSYGQGEAFTRANVRDFGGGDLRDIQVGIDAVLKVVAVDPARLGIYGHSYGGFMTMWTVTHSTRFKAAVAGAGIANWISYYGQNGIDQWMIPFFGASAYDDPEVYRADSPISTIKAAKTPTLIYVGERDVECPPAQSVEFWHGLKAMGVPTSLVIYEGAGHRLRKPEQIHDREQRIVDWFDQRLR